jgi:hypothetical protein
MVYPAERCGGSPLFCWYASVYDGGPQPPIPRSGAHHRAYEGRIHGHMRNGEPHLYTYNK